MGTTFRDAGVHSPRAIRNEIVRQVDNMDRESAYIADQVFPLVELSDNEETYFTMNGVKMPMSRSTLGAESDVVYLEDLGEDQVTVDVFKAKTAPERGANQKLNNEQEILNLFNQAAATLREKLMLTRSLVAWQGLDGIDGLIGQDGATVHPDLPAGHVLTGSDYSATGTATPVDDFIEAEFQVSNDGNQLDQAGPMTSYVSPSIMRDLKLNDDLQSNWDNISALNEDQLSTALQIDQIREVRTTVARTNANGEPIDSNGNVVDKPSNAATDNILEPWDAGASTNRRNVVIMAPGVQTAFIPWFLENLTDVASDEDVSGSFAVNENQGFFTQSWVPNDPMVRWFKIVQEIGFHLWRPENIAILQDV